MSLVEAAQNYHAVLEENRKLYNEVQDLKGFLFSLTIYYDCQSLYSQ